MMTSNSVMHLVQGLGKPILQLKYKVQQQMIRWSGNLGRISKSEKVSFSKTLQTFKLSVRIRLIPVIMGFVSSASPGHMFYLWSAARLNKWTELIVSIIHFVVHHVYATEDEIRKLIIKPSDATCFLDPMPTWLVQAQIDILLPTITKIVNESLSSGLSTLIWRKKTPL